MIRVADRANARSLDRHAGTGTSGSDSPAPRGPRIERGRGDGSRLRRQGGLFGHWLTRSGDISSPRCGPQPGRDRGPAAAVSPSCRRHRCRAQSPVGSAGDVYGRRRRRELRRPAERRCIDGRRRLRAGDVHAGSEPGMASHSVLADTPGNTGQTVRLSATAEIAGDRVPSFQLRPIRREAESCCCTIQPE